MLPIQWTELGFATLQTVYMVSVSTCCVILLGLPLGTWLFSMRAIHVRPLGFRLLSMLVNATRSVPFIILLVAIIPLTLIR